MKLLLLLISCVYVTALPFSNVSNKDGDLSIINGNNARRYQFPYMVSVQFQGRHKCGASIISESWLVSAAHCYDNPTERHRAVAGLLVQGEKHKDIQNISIEKIILYPDYSPVDGSNDIALLKLENPLKFSRSVMTVGLPEPNIIPSGQAVTSGWGHIVTNPKRIQATVLQYLQVKLITNKECSKYVKDNPLPLNPHRNDRLAITNFKICGFPQEALESGCNGDSGGPLVQANVLLGVVHGGFDSTCHQSINKPYPHLYTRVSHYIDFINEHVEL